MEPEFYMVKFTFFQFSKGNFRAYKSYMTKAIRKIFDDSNLGSAPGKGHA